MFGHGGNNGGSNRGRFVPLLASVSLREIEEGEQREAKSASAANQNVLFADGAAQRKQAHFGGNVALRKASMN